MVELGYYRKRGSEVYAEVVENINHFCHSHTTVENPMVIIQYRDITTNEKRGRIAMFVTDFLHFYKIYSPQLAVLETKVDALNPVLADLYNKDK